MENSKKFVEMELIFTKLTMVSNAKNNHIGFRYVFNPPIRRKCFMFEIIDRKYNNPVNLEIEKLAPKGAHTSKLMDKKKRYKNQR